jgi:pimeloyl-ACP methyl ester carboxylesterase
MEDVMPRLEVNGAELYYEVRGGGPPVLLIMGFTGDAGHFETLADALASEFTVISYDRRGNGRSPRPPGWAATGPEEQADDAAALLAALGLSPAAVFGTSAGANFALCLLIRHPETVSGAVLHETALVRLFDDPGARGAVSELVQQAMGTGATPAALEALWGMWRETLTGSVSRPPCGRACSPVPRPSSGSRSGATRAACPMTRRWPRSRCPSWCS